MTRVTVLRLGYGALGVTLLALAVGQVAGALIPAGLAVALVAGFLLAFSDDDLPKWAGITLLAYLLVSVLTFVAASPITIRGGARLYVPAMADESLQYYLFLASPLLLTATGLAAAWERERPARFLLAGALAGFVVVAGLTLSLAPNGSTSAAVSTAQQQGNLLEVLYALSAIAGASGALWSASRPEEYA